MTNEKFFILNLFLMRKILLIFTYCYIYFPILYLYIYYIFNQKNYLNLLRVLTLKIKFMHTNGNQLHKKELVVPLKIGLIL